MRASHHRLPRKAAFVRPPKQKGKRAEFFHGGKEFPGRAAAHEHFHGLPPSVSGHGRQARTMAEGEKGQTEILQSPMEENPMMTPVRAKNEGQSRTESDRIGQNRTESDTIGQNRTLSDNSGREEIKEKAGTVSLFPRAPAPAVEAAPPPVSGAPSVKAPRAAPLSPFHRKMRAHGRQLQPGQSGHEAMKWHAARMRQEGDYCMRQMGAPPLRHGLFTKAMRFGSLAEAKAYQRLRAEMRRDLRPLDLVEEAMLEKMTVALWRTRQAMRAEREGQEISQRGRTELAALDRQYHRAYAALKRAAAQREDALERAEREQERNRRHRERQRERAC